MQNNVEIVEAVEVAEAAATPVELTLEQLDQVGGGLSPNSNWGSSSDSPNSNWG